MRVYRVHNKEDIRFWDVCLEVLDYKYYVKIKVCKTDAKLCVNALRRGLESEFLLYFRAAETSLQNDLMRTNSGSISDVEVLDD